MSDILQTNVLWDLNGICCPNQCTDPVCHSRTMWGKDAAVSISPRASSKCFTAAIFKAQFRMCETFVKFANDFARPLTHTRTHIHRGGQDFVLVLSIVSSKCRLLAE